jgi:hypothetical protein
MSEKTHACKTSVLLGVDTKGATHILAKGPEVSYLRQRELLCDITLANGLVDGVQLETAALLGNGAYRKRRSFKPQKNEPAPKKKTTKAADSE